MLHRIFSKATGQLLHLIGRRDAMQNGRANLIDDDQYLQCASLRVDKNTSFRAHKHIDCHRTITITQESWVVISGSVLATFYDFDGSELESVTLMPGDISITLLGGHSYVITSDDTLVYEFKTGPYLGQERDKVYFNEIAAK